MLIGREKEKELLETSINSDVSELIAIYGRRRVGKTYLIRQVCQKYIKFEVTGVYGGSLRDELKVFFNQLKQSTGLFDRSEVPKDWHEAFEFLKRYLDTLKGKNKKVIFFDELPWLYTHKSKFLSFFGHFWNTYCEKRKDLIVIVCGSAASFMIKKIIRDKGSLHARLSLKIRLEPFSLYETEQYLISKKIDYKRYDIIRLYCAIGGIPYYLSRIKRGNSVARNIQNLCFEPGGDLLNEFDDIFISLFSDSDMHIKIVSALSASRKGITRNELLKKAGIPNNGRSSDSILELIESGFVSKYKAFGKKSQMTLYRLCDEFSAFYLKYIKQYKGQSDIWHTLSDKQTNITWSGFVFETICLKHIEQIKKALGISGVLCTNSGWSNGSTQIDMIIDRNDGIINLCEMKFYNREYTIGKKEEANIRHKKNEFIDDTKTRKNVYVTMITTFGIRKNKYYFSIVDNELTMDILFEKS